MYKNAATRCEKALEERLLELEGDCALAQAELLAGEPLAREGRGVGRLRASDPHCDHHGAGRSHQTEQGGKEEVHAIAVMRRMMMLPTASRPAARPMSTQPTGLINIGRK